MIVVSGEESETGILECCLPHEEDANAGPSSVDDRSSDYTLRDPSTLLPNPRVSTADVGSACRFMHILVKLPHMGETGASDTLASLGPPTK